MVLFATPAALPASQLVWRETPEEEEWKKNKIREREGGDEEEKPNKLSGCNNVLPPDKLLANHNALTPPSPQPLPTALAADPLGIRPSWQQWPLSLRATGPLNRGQRELDDVKL